LPAGVVRVLRFFRILVAEQTPGFKSMNHQLRTITVRIANEDGGLRAWSDDLPGLSLTCPNHQALFDELTPKIASLLKQQGFDGKIVREIYQFIVETKTI
jgi:hypothetical protein